ncbi:MAG: GumC family protein [Candidatus Calescibacterium sp.]
MEEKNIYEEEIDLFELFSRIWKRRKLILAITLSITAISGIISFFITPVYKATAKIIPLASQKQSFIPIPSDMLGLMGLLGTEFGGSRSATIKAILQSRELAKRVIENAGIKKYLYGKLWDEKSGSLRKDIPPHKIPSDDELAEKFLKENLVVTEDKKTGVIDISILFPKEPTLSAIIANEYIKELSKILNEKAYTVAKKNRIFLEERVKQTELKLSQVEQDFKDFQQRYNVVAIDKQMEEGLKIYAELVAKLAEKEMQLEVMRKITSPDNPEVVTLNYEINELRKKIRELEEGQKVMQVKGYILDRSKKLIIPLENVPELAMEYLRRRRELEIQNEIYKVLLRALEQARIEEEKETLSFEVVDYAYTPRFKYKPKRKLIVMVSFVSSLFASVFLVLLLDSIQNRREQKR